MAELSIGKLAKACGVNIDTVRYYERKGLLTPTDRTHAGYRVFSNETVKRLKFVRRAQTLGFTLAEIKEILTLSETPEADCADIRDYTHKKITEIKERITDLAKIIYSLEKLAKSCPGEGKPLNECSILQYYYGEDA